MSRRPMSSILAHEQAWQVWEISPELPERWGQSCETFFAPVKKLFQLKAEYITKCCLTYIDSLKKYWSIKSLWHRYHVASVTLVDAGVNVGTVHSQFLLAKLKNQ